MSKSHNSGRSSYKKRAIRKLLRERDGDLCYYCHTAMKFFDDVTTRLGKAKAMRSPHAATVEHLQELSKGGSRELWNCVLAHKQCNSAVVGLTLDEKVARAGLKLQSRTRQASQANTS